MKKYYLFSMIFLVSFSNYLIFYSYPFLLDSHHIANGVTGIVVGISTVLTLVLRILSGFWIDKNKSSYMLSIIMFFYILAFIFLICKQDSLIILGRLIIGIALGALSTLLFYYSIMLPNNTKERAKSVSLYTLFTMLPTCLAPYFSLKIKESYGIDAVIFLAISIMVFAFILSLLTERGISVGGQHTEKNILKSFFSVLKTKEIKLIISLLSIIYIVSGTTVTFLPKIIEHYNYKVLSLYFLVFSCALVLPRLIFKNKMPDGKTFPFKSLFICLFLCLAGSLINLFLIEKSMILLGAVFNGFALGLIYPTAMSYVVCIVEDALKGSVTSVISCAADFGVIIANLVLGSLSFYFDYNVILAFPIISVLFLIVYFTYYFNKYKKIEHSYLF